MSVSVALVVITCLVWLFTLRERRRAKDRAAKAGTIAALPSFPGPMELPLIGALLPFSLIKLRGWFLPHQERAGLLCERYGKTCTGRAAALHMLLTEDPDIAHEILQSPDFAARCTSHPRYKDATFGKGPLGLFLPGGEGWKAVRKYTIRTLRQFGFGEVKATEEFIDDELEYFYRRIDRDRAACPDGIFMRKYFKIFLFNAIWRSFAGHRCDENDPKFHKLIADVEKGSSIEVGFDVEWVFPFVRYLPGFNHSYQLVKALHRVQNYFKEVMEQRRASGSYKAGPPTNFIDHFLQKLDEERENPDTHFTDEQFMATGCDMMCASTDTTANSAQFTVLYLLKNPHVLARFRAEIDTLVGHDRPPSYDDFKRMPYAKALFCEVLRHCNILPVIGRGSSCDTVVAGHFVPKDVLVGVCAARIHMDPEIWGDPQNFRPERFLDESGQNIVMEDKLLVFGKGKHMCLGETMAKVMWFKFVAGVIQRYDIRRSPTHPDLNPRSNGGLTNAPGGFYCVVEPRKDGVGAKGAGGRAEMAARERAIA